MVIKQKRYFGFAKIRNQLMNKEVHQLIALFQRLKINIPQNATVERISILEDCCIDARNAHTSIVEFAGEQTRSVFQPRDISG